MEWGSARGRSLRIRTMMRFFRFLPEEQRQAFLEGLSEKAS